MPPLRSNGFRYLCARDRSFPWVPISSMLSEKPADPIELRVYRGADGSFTLYEDENDGYDYEKGAFATIPIRWDEAAKTLTIGERSGRFPGMLESRNFRVVVVDDGQGAGINASEHVNKTVSYDGHALSVKP